MHRPHGSRPLLADRGPAARRALGIAPRRGARRRAPRRPQRSGPPPPMGLEWRALHACAAGAPAGRAARGGPAAEPIAVQAAALLEDFEEWPRPAGVPGRLARFRRSCEAFPAHYVVLSAPDAEGATRGEAGEEASSPGSSESSRGVGLPVGGAGVGGGEHCDPVVVGHCALRETTTAGAGAGSAGACAVLCSVVVRPELRRTGASAASWSSAPRPRRAPAGSLSCTCGPWTAPRRCCASTSGLASSWRRPPEEQRGGGRLEALTAAVARPAHRPRGPAWWSGSARRCVARAGRGEAAGAAPRAGAGGRRARGPRIPGSGHSPA
ncbi:unnamed protein product [Prorocentrum cordatum]|uniref:Glycylpeptide N-tetradecanoyltransferase n=1 Tax=Prorocentrum cordatum TaxID=2364126 RepID=A0ABN9X3Y8_9DINO|nr:unnamed protein product [Polarella glacialis]